MAFQNHMLISERKMFVITKPFKNFRVNYLPPSPVFLTRFRWIY